ncbi:ABC-type nitrate/sulfonate/bicarbonate transport system permease component OS=Castellaniella defragrans OX=75697 GN=HNR28_003475 PE=3 SV=1 [Castellaniella defragrans]
MADRVLSAARERYVILALMVLVAVVGVLLWQLASTLVFAVPDPLKTIDAFKNVRAGLAPAAFATFSNAAVGFVLAVTVGAMLGVAFGRSEYWYQVLSPIVVVGGAVPKIIIYPILLLLLGLGPSSVIGMGFIGGVFSVLINVMVAVRNIKPVYVLVGRSLNVSPWRAFRRIYLPAVSLPLLTGVRLCFGLTMVNVIFAELFAAKAGMGKTIMDYYGVARYAEMMVMILILFLVAMGGSIVLWWLERRVRRAVT